MQLLKIAAEDLLGNSLGAETLLSKWGADFFVFVQVTWARCGRGMCHLLYIVQKLKKMLP